MVRYFAVFLIFHSILTMSFSASEHNKSSASMDELFNELPSIEGFEVPHRFTKTLKPTDVSVEKILEGVVVDCKINNFTVHCLDGFASLLQGVNPIHKDIVRTLNPYGLFRPLDGDCLPECVLKLPNFPLSEAINSVVQVFIFFAEAFGKEIDPVYFYATRPRLEEDTFNTNEEIQIIYDDFRDKEATLRSKLTEITILKSHEKKNFKSSIFSSVPEFYKFFADFGITEAQHNYACMLFNGDQIPQDFLEAIRYFEMLPDNKYPGAWDNIKRAQYYYGMMLKDGIGVSKDLEAAFKYLWLASRSTCTEGREASHQLRKEADRGDKIAQFRYGQFLLNGSAMYSEDLVKFSLGYLKKSAAQDYANAQYECGKVYLIHTRKMKLRQTIHISGLSKREQVEIFPYWELAAKQGHEEALKELKEHASYGYDMASFIYGKILEDGPDTLIDKKLALTYIKNAADRGYKDAQLYYACRLYADETIPQNQEQSLIYFELFAKHKDDSSLWISARDLEKEKKKEAGVLFKILADRGFIDAQVHYAKTLRERSDFSQDPSEHLKYLKMSADQGCPISQHNYALAIYLNEDGIKQDVFEATVYFIRSAKQGLAPAQDFIHKLMPESFPKAGDSYWLCSLTNVEINLKYLSAQ